jgi:hypothetical protein
MMWHRLHLLAEAWPPVARRQPDRAAEDLFAMTGYVHAAVPQRLDPDDGREHAGDTTEPRSRIRKQPHQRRVVIKCPVTRD